MADFDSLVDDSPGQAAPQPQGQPQGQAQDFDSLKDDAEQYSGAGQTIAAGAEGALRGLIGPAAPVAEKLFGVPYSEQRGRQSAHPIVSGAGEVAGLGGGILTGTGEAALMGKAGEAASTMAGLGDVAKDAPLISRIGSSAVKQAAEMAVLQGADNVTKAIMQDPSAASESALANVGLAAALGAGGGAFTAGVLSPLWQATMGPKLEAGLKGLASRMGGVEGTEAVKTAEMLEQQTGVPMPNELKAVVNETPGAMEGHSYLSQNDTSIAGRKYQKMSNEYESQLAGKSIEALGRTPESIHDLPDLDKYTAGRTQGEQLKSELQNIAQPTIDGYTKFNDLYKDSPISLPRKQAIADQIGQKAIEQGWHKASDDASSELAAKVMKDLDKQDSVVDLKKYITNLNNSNPYGKETYGAAKDLSKILNGALSDTISENIARAGGGSEKALQEVSNYSQLRQNYAKLMDHFEQLDEHLKVGKWDSPTSFLNALQDMSTQHGERILDRLSGKNAANVLDVLKETPETLNKVKQYHVDKLLSEAVQKAPAGKNINTRYIADTALNPNKMSPQVRDLIMSPEQQKTVMSVNQVMDALKDPTHNFSNTARTAAKQSHGAISPISMIAALLGHGEAGILSWLGGMGLSEVKPALKLAMMKFLGSDAPVNSAGFKAMASYIDHAHAGGTKLEKASKALFQPGLKILNDSQMPSAKDIQKLDKLVAEHKENPNLFLENAQKQQVAHYMPDHQTTLTQTQTNALEYLKSIKPSPYRPSPLDKEIQPSKAEEARYNRALTIAQNPLVVLQHVKDGTLKVNDLQDLKSMYPSYFNMVSQAVSNEMINHSDEQIPYRTKISASLLLGQPLDTSMQPASIMAAQPLPKAPQQPMPSPKGKKGTSTLGKSNASYRTPNQSAEADRSGRE